MKALFPISVVIGLFALFLSSPAPAAWVFQGIGFAPGETFSKASALSHDGSVVVGVGASWQGIRWTAAGGVISLPDTDLGFSDAWGARDVSSDGSLVVGSNFAAGTYGPFWHWTQSGGTAGTFSQVRDPYVHAASGDGNRVVVSGFENSGNISKVVDLQGNLLAQSGYNTGGFSGISSDGTAVIGHSNSSGQAYRFFIGESNSELLGDLPGGALSSFALDVSADGAVIVGQGTSSNGREAFRWEAGIMAPLGDLPGGAFDSSATDVSDDGSVIIGRANGGQPFIWDAVNGMRDFTGVLTADGALPAGWMLMAATDVSGDGTAVAGWGINPMGQTEGWVARVPEPSSWVLFAAMAILAGSGRREML